MHNIQNDLKEYLLKDGIYSNTTREKIHALFSELFAIDDTEKRKIDGIIFLIITLKEFMSHDLIADIYSDYLESQYILQNKISHYLKS